MKSKYQCPRFKHFLDEECDREEDSQGNIYGDCYLECHLCGREFEYVWKSDGSYGPNLNCDAPQWEDKPTPWKDATDILTKEDYIIRSF